jgi:hypothetical protein
VNHCVGKQKAIERVEVSGITGGEPPEDDCLVKVRHAALPIVAYE